MAEISIEKLPRKRKEAKASGSRHYFTGKECSRGHVAQRITSTGNCLKCAAENSSRARNLDPEKHAQASRSWRIRNPEKQRASNGAWIAANFDKYSAASRERVAAWQKANPDRVRASAKVTQHRRRARKLNSGGSHTVTDITDIRASQKDRCGYCRGKLNRKGHVDHIKALSKGGSNARSNLQLLCAPCNKSKSARDPISFAQSLGMLL